MRNLKNLVHPYEDSVAYMTCPLYMQEAGEVVDAPEVVRLPPSAEVALVLAKINRFGGRTCYPYSVAQHAVFCAELVQSEGGGHPQQFDALHHDDTEVLTGDILGPLKRNLLVSSCGQQEPFNVWERFFRTHKDSTSLTHLVDKWACALEQEYLQGFRGRVAQYPDMDWRHSLRPMHWRAAAQAYIDADLRVRP